MPVGGESRRNDKYGITHAHHFFTKRNLYVISCLWNAINELEEDQAIKNALMAVVTGVMQGVSKLQNSDLTRHSQHDLSGTFVGSMIREWNVLDWVQGKYKSIRKLKAAIASFDKNEVFISTNSLTKTTLPTIQLIIFSLILHRRQLFRTKFYVGIMASSHNRNTK